MTEGNGHVIDPNGDARRALQEAVAEHGPEVLSNAGVMENVCRDHLAGLPGESILIGDATRTDIPALLGDLIPRLGNYGAIQSAAATLAGEHSLDLAASLWVVREFARALGYIAPATGTAAAVPGSGPRPVPGPGPRPVPDSDPRRVPGSGPRPVPGSGPPPGAGPAERPLGTGGAAGAAESSGTAGAGNESENARPGDGEAGRAVAGGAVAGAVVAPAAGAAEVAGAVGVAGVAADEASRGEGAGNKAAASGPGASGAAGSGTVGTSGASTSDASTSGVSGVSTTGAGTGAAGVGAGGPGVTGPVGGGGGPVGTGPMRDVSGVSGPAAGGAWGGPSAPGGTPGGGTGGGGGQGGAPGGAAPEAEPGFPLPLPPGRLPGRQSQRSNLLNRNTVGIAAAIALIAGYLGVAAVAHLSPFPAKAVPTVSASPSSSPPASTSSRPVSSPDPSADPSPTSQLDILLTKIPPAVRRAGDCLNAGTGSGATAVIQCQKIQGLAANTIRYYLYPSKTDLASGLSSFLQEATFIKRGACTTTNGSFSDFIVNCESDFTIKTPGMTGSIAEYVNKAATQEPVIVSTNNEQHVMAVLIGTNDGDLLAYWNKFEWVVTP